MVSYGNKVHIQISHGARLAELDSNLGRISINGARLELDSNLNQYKWREIGITFQSEIA